MTNAWMDTAASSTSALGLIGAVVVIVLVLIGAFILGARVRRRESAPPRPHEQPHLPAEGPVREVREQREADEVPHSDRRLTPHELPNHGNSPSRSAPAKGRPRWSEGSSGSFGSGGPGGR